MAGESRIITTLRRLAGYRVLEVGMALVLAVALVRLGRNLPERYRQWDFNHSYATARLLLDGQNPYTTPMAPLCEQLGLVSSPEIPVATNPPALIWLFVPLAMLPVRVAFVIWLFVQAASLAVVLGLTKKLLGDRLSDRAWFFLCAGTLASNVVLAHFFYSRVELLLAALLLTAYWLLRTGRGVVACMIVTVVGLLKIYPLVLIPWFVWRAGVTWRVRGWAAGASGGLAVAVVGLIGVNLWRDFFVHASAIVSGFALEYMMNFSLPSFLGKLGWVSHILPTPLIWPLAVGVGMLLFVVTYGLCLGGASVPELEFCLFSVALLVAGPLAWLHYFVLLIFPVAVVVVQVGKRPTVPRLLILIVSVACVSLAQRFTGSFLDQHLVVNVLMNFLPLYGAAGLFGLLVNELRSARRVSAP